MLHSFVEASFPIICFAIVLGDTVGSLVKVESGIEQEVSKPFFHGKTLDKSFFGRLPNTDVDQTFCILSKVWVKPVKIENAKRETSPKRPTAKEGPMGRLSAKCWIVCI